MGDQLRWGVLSTASNTERLWNEHTNALRYAVASRDLARAQSYAAERDIPQAYGAYEDLLSDEDVDIVYNPLPNSLHTEWTIRALEAGKHVLCEKPFSRDASEVKRAFDVAQANGLVLAEAFMWRHHPQVAKLRELLDGGVIGTLRCVRASFAFNLGSLADIRASAELEGGAHMDVGAYVVSGCRLVTGTNPERVYAEGATGAAEVDMTMVATLRFPDEVLATIDCSMASVFRYELEAIGDAASIYLEDPWTGRNPRIEIRRDDQSRELVAVEDSNPYTVELEDFEAAVRGERPLLFGRDDAVGQARTLAALHQSMAERSPVDIGAQ
jgi:xylose dehydrogenase (NAD/NADP)